MPRLISARTSLAPYSLLWQVSLWMTQNILTTHLPRVAVQLLLRLATFADPREQNSVPSMFGWDKPKPALRLGGIS